jgi:hypothetical protein
MSKFTLTFFLLTLLSDAVLFGWQYVDGSLDMFALSFASQSLMWCLALLVKESTSSFQIRLLEHRNRECERELSKLKMKLL